MATPIIWITWDEAHIDTLGLFGAGTHQTPHVDGLAACSHHYLNAYTASPVCLPARCAMATGLMPHHSTSMSNGFGASLRRDKPNVFSLMHGQKYHNALFGKCHFTPVPYPYTLPLVTREGEHIAAFYESLGIDTLLLQDDKNNSMWFYDDYSKELEEMGLLKPYKDARANKEMGNVFPFPGPDEMHPDKWVASRAVEYIQKADDASFIWVSFSGPHYPIDTPKSYTDRIDLSKLPPRKIRPGEWDDRTKLHANSYHGPGVTEGSGHAKDGAQKNYTQAYWDRWQKGYRGNVLLLDDCMGEILAAVRQRWGNDALILFTADHGDMAGHHGIWAKNETAYEDVLRIPMMVHLPGQVDGQVHQERASNLDLLPTTLKAAFGCHYACDGRDMVTPETSPAHILSVKDNVVAILEGQIKLVFSRWRDQHFYEMYDLANDPSEFVNVYDDPAYTPVRERLTATLQQDPDLLSRVFYDGSTSPYWLAPKQPCRK